jgi:hypothetical protein
MPALHSPPISFGQFDLIPLRYRRPTKPKFQGDGLMATAAPQEELNPFEIAKQQFDRAAD